MQSENTVEYKKKEWERLVMDIIEFENEDIISTSKTYELPVDTG